MITITTFMTWHELIKKKNRSLSGDGYLKKPYNGNVYSLPPSPSQSLSFLILCIYFILFIYFFSISIR